MLIVTNETIAPLYLERTIASLTRGRPDLQVESVILPDGEQFKNMVRGLRLVSTFHTIVAVELWNGG